MLTLLEGPELFQLRFVDKLASVHKLPCVDKLFTDADSAVNTADTSIMIITYSGEKRHCHKVTERNNTTGIN